MCFELSCNSNVLFLFVVESLDVSTLLFIGCLFCCFLGLSFFRNMLSVSRMISIVAFTKFSSYSFGVFAGSEGFRDM